MNYAADGVFTLPATVGGGKEIDLLQIAAGVGDVTITPQAGESINGVVDDTRVIDTQYSMWKAVDTSVGWVVQSVGSLTQTLSWVFAKSAVDVSIPGLVAFQNITFGTVVKDTDSAWSGTAYTVPKNGDYEVLVNMIWDNQSGATNDLTNIQVRIDGVVAEEIIIDPSANFGQNDPAEQTMHVILPGVLAGQVIDFGVANTTDIMDFNAESSIYIRELPSTVSIPAGSLVVDPIESRVGYADVGDIQAAGSNPRPFVGDFASVTSTQSGTIQVFSFVFNTPFANANYNLQTTVEELTKLSTDIAANDFTIPIITQKTAASFEMMFEETSATAQDLRIHVLAFDKFPNATAMRAEDVAVTEWAAYTPTLHGTTTAPTRATTHNEKAYYRVIGKQLEIMYQYSHTAAAGAVAGSGVIWLGLTCWVHC